MQRELTRDATLFGLMAAAVLVFWTDNTITALLLLAECVLAFLWYAPAERLFFLGAGAFGVALETVGGAVGIWTYTFPNFATVPVWIFFCWGFTFQFLLSLRKAFAR